MNFIRLSIIKLADSEINFNTDGIHDIMSIINNDHRKNTINNININKSYKTLFIDNCYGKERDEYFYRTKIYINIHCSNNHNTMELIRIINLISNRVIVITTNSVYSDLLYIKDFLFKK